MQKINTSVTFIPEHPHASTAYGTVFYVPGSASQTLNDYVRSHTKEITLHINGNEQNWVTCTVVFAEGGYFPALQQAALYSPLIAVEEEEESTFLTTSLSDVHPEEIAEVTELFFTALQNSFDEALDGSSSESNSQLAFHEADETPLMESRELQEAPCAEEPCLMMHREAALGKRETRAHKDRPGRLEITPYNYRVLLPDYASEIHFTAQVKALYVLFLNHPEGIRMKDIGDYKEEYIYLYFQLTNRSDTDKLRESVNKLLDVCNPNALNVKKSQCNSAIYSALPREDLYRYYEIEVRRGLPHKINLNRRLVHMPENLSVKGL